MSGWADWARRAGAVAGALGTVVAGAGVGALAERLSLGRTPGPSGPAEPYGRLRGQPVSVYADDGVRLHAEVEGPPAPPYSIVFSHGYALTSDSWHYQRRDFARRFPQARRVFWDQRGHGSSERGPQAHATVDQTGADLAAVIAATAPTGPVVLVGHSMGGMSIMAMADRAPRIVEERVIGVGFVSTSSGRMAQRTFGVPQVVAPAIRWAGPAVVAGVHRVEGVLTPQQLAGSDLVSALTRHWSYSSPVPVPLVEFTAAMIASTPLEVLADFASTFETHDKLPALAVLNRGVETLVLVGERDLLTPPAHSRAIADAVPGAELVVVPRAGHLVMLEHPDVVTEHLADLVERALRALPGRQVGA